LKEELEVFFEDAFAECEVVWNAMRRGVVPRHLNRHNISFEFVFEDLGHLSNARLVVRY
jgi:hypothetical protein